jgi:adenosylhomocysteine nucleosidase
VRAGGGTPAGAGVAAAGLIGDGATALISFGLAGGLDPALRPGTVIVPSVVLSDGERLAVDAGLAARFGGITGQVIRAGPRVVTSAAEKQGLFATTGAQAVDLESGAVARVALAYGLPFVVVRAICDPAERDLPAAALVALDPDGAIGLGAVMRSVLRRPGQIPGLVAVGWDAARARRALIGAARRFQGPVNTSSR